MFNSISKKHASKNFDKLGGEIEELKEALVNIGYSQREVEYMIHRAQKENGNNGQNQNGRIIQTLKDQLQMAKKFINLCKQ